MKGKYYRNILILLYLSTRKKEIKKFSLTVLLSSKVLFENEFSSKRLTWTAFNHAVVIR